MYTKNVNTVPQVSTKGTSKNKKTVKPTKQVSTDIISRILNYDRDYSEMSTSDKIEFIKAVISEVILKSARGEHYGHIYLDKRTSEALRSVPWEILRDGFAVFNFRQVQGSLYYKDIRVLL